MARKQHPSPARDKIDVDDVIERIKAGQSQAEIAASIGVSVGVLSDVLNEPENAERSARARSVSAESWLDKGVEVLQSALSKDSGIDPSAAKALAQEYARRAAIRNPAYRDKVQTEVTVPGGGPVKYEVTKIERVIVDPKS